MRKLTFLHAAIVGQYCPGNCSSLGTCDEATGVCTCDAQQSGRDCSVPLCLNNCSLRGVCLANHTCECDAGFSSADCSEGAIGNTYGFHLTQTSHRIVPKLRSRRMSHHRKAACVRLLAGLVGQQLYHTDPASGPTDDRLEAEELPRNSACSLYDRYVPRF